VITRALLIGIAPRLALAAPLLPILVQAQELPTIRVGTLLVDTSKTVYYGIRSGLFHSHGINVIAVIEPSGSAGLSAVVGGSLDVMLASLPPIFQGYLRGVPFQVVAPAQEYVTEAPNALLLVQKSSSINTARDLNGKRLGVLALSDLNSAAARAWVDQNGGDSNSISMAEVPNSAMLSALDTGRVDAIVVLNPFGDAALATGRARILGKPFDAIAKHFEAGAWASTSDNVAKNFDAMRRFARAMHEATVYANKHHRETVDLVASYTGIDRDVILHSTRSIDPEYFDIPNMQPLMDACVKYKLIDKPFPIRDLISPVALQRA
jgi:NitT/TauT family transport system substrate-binding protein